MTLYIFDTDHLTLLQNNHPSVVQRVSETDPNNIAVTIVTIEEQLRGRLDIIRQASQSSQMERLVFAYIGLQSALNYFKNFNVVSFSQQAYTHYAEFRRQRIRIGTQDLRIAAIVLAVNGILVTRNQRDFSKVPGLRFEDWTIS